MTFLFTSNGIMIAVDLGNTRETIVFNSRKNLYLIAHTDVGTRRTVKRGQSKVLHWKMVKYMYPILFSEIINKGVKTNITILG